ncbi:hypothetical protein [Helicobacter sp. T3_23-1056]
MEIFVLSLCAVAFAVFCVIITYTFGYAPLKDMQKDNDSKQ